MSNMIHTMFFSPTGTTKKITEAVADTIQKALDSTMITVNLTKPSTREQKFAIEKEDILVLGLPVYYGRIPATVEAAVKDVLGNGAPAIILAVYGNRHYDDALLEMSDLLTENGFHVIAAGAFIGEHSFSRKLAAGRPDEGDIKLAQEFGEKVAAKLKGGERTSEINVTGNVPYTKRGSVPGYPKTDDRCTDCKQCVSACPVAIIDSEDPSKVEASQCIKCFACVKICPEDAKYFDDETILGIAQKLETAFAERKEPITIV